MMTFMILRNHSMKRGVAFLILVICTLTSFGQAEEFLQLKKKYPNDAIAKISNEKLIEISLDNNEISIFQEVFEEDMLLNESAKFATKESVDYSSFFQLEEISASSFIYEGNRYREYKVQDFNEKDEIGDSFYDDVKTVSFLFPKLEPGAKKQLKYKMNIKNPRFLNAFYFASAHPIIHSKITIEVDDRINLDFKEFNTKDVDIKRTNINKRGKNIYTWEVENLEGFEFEDGAPNFKNVLPHIIPIIKNYQSDDETINLLSETKDLYNWYYSLVKDINKDKPNPQLVQVVEELTNEKTSDLEKVRAIYYWAQENIKYIDFEFALGGFIPREANDVYEKKYGDCKDNSSIMLEMLEIAGLKGQLTWIGTRDIPYKYNEVPTPVVDNHMILSYTNEGQTYFLDATGRYVPLELPTSFIQGKEALVADGNENFKVLVVPEVPADKNSYIDEIELTISDRTLLGKGHSKMSGYFKIDTFNYLESRTQKQELLEFYNLNLMKGSNRFLIGEFEEINKYSYDKDFEIKYDFTIKDYCNVLGEEIYVNLNLDKSILEYKIKKDRKHAIELEYKLDTTMKNILNIPQGKTIDYLPENVQVSTPIFNATITYTVEANKITYSINTVLDTLVIEKEDQAQFNEALKTLEKAFKEVVVLK